MKNALVIGATGLLGYSTALALTRNGWNVRGIGKTQIHSHIFPNNFEYICGDFYNDVFLTKCLEGIDKVFFFLSTTFPSTNTVSLKNEINMTLQSLDYLLHKMVSLKINDIVFPSSGGTIYGNIESGKAKETDALKPITPYGFGKMMCENILNFYSKFGIFSTILRVGNVYGASTMRNTTQGVIDIFVQQALKNEVSTIWGSAITNIRDYIFIDDFSEAVVKISALKTTGIDIYNLSSGNGTTLESIIEKISRNIKMQLKYIPNDSTSEIRRVVLDVSKIHEKTGWKAKYDIENGIVETINRKKYYMESRDKHDYETRNSYIELQHG